MRHTSGACIAAGSFIGRLADKDFGLETCITGSSQAKRQARIEPGMHSHTCTKAGMQRIRLRSRHYTRLSSKEAGRF